MKKTFKNVIGKNMKPFIIAEISANHNGSLEQAKKLISAAKKAGADAVKIQTYEPESMTINSNKEDFKIKHGIWKGKKLYNLYKQAQTPFSWHKELFNQAKKNKILIFSTPFDFKAVDLLESLKVPFYKIASFEITDHPLIEYIAEKKKPIFLSTGMANKGEIKEALKIIKSKGVKDVLLFHCISSYPSKVEEYNLNMINTLAKDFNTHVGLSDHTTGNEAALASIALGAVAIEKHFKLETSNDSPDSKFSIDPVYMKNLVSQSKNLWKGLGGGNYERAKEEKQNLIFRRSLYFVRDLKKGEKISKDNIKSLRPSFGLQPKHLKKVLGKKVKSDVKSGDRVTWQVVK